MDAMKLVRQTKPDIAVVDITLRGSNGLDLVKQMQEEAPEVKVLVLSMHEEALHGERALRAGARGYLTGAQTSSEVIQMINRIVAGDVCVSRGSARCEDAASFKRSAVDSLADREKEVFTLLGRGEGTREIANILQIAESTVEPTVSVSKRSSAFAAPRNSMSAPAIGCAIMVVDPGKLPLRIDLPAG